MIQTPSPSEEASTMVMAMLATDVDGSSRGNTDLIESDSLLATDVDGSSRGSTGVIESDSPQVMAMDLATDVDGSAVAPGPAAPARRSVPAVHRMVTRDLTNQHLLLVPPLQLQQLMAHSAVKELFKKPLQERVQLIHDDSTLRGLSQQLGPILQQQPMQQLWPRLNLQQRSPLQQLSHLLRLLIGLRFRQREEELAQRYSYE